MNSEEILVYNALVGSPVAGLVASYEGLPSVFAGEAPENAVLPYVVFNVVSAIPLDTHDSEGFDALVDVRCYAERTGSLVALNNLALAAWTAMHRTRPTVGGRQVAGVEVLGGPNALPIEEHAVGRVLTARIRSTVTA